jgi:hypothetical protein
MSDISQQQLDELLSSMQKSSASLGKIADKFGASPSGKANAVNKIKDDLSTSRKSESDAIKKSTGGLMKHVEAIGGMTKSSQDFTRKMSGLVTGLELFGLEKVFAKIIQYGSENIETYQTLTKYGQNFGGSMIEMSKQAAAAGMPLQMFANVIKHNSLVVGSMGTEAFFKLNKELRKSTEQQGMYGYTMEQLGDLQADYMQTQLLAGKNLKTLTGPQSKKDLVDFVANISNVSEALSANRDVVMANTMAALQDNSVLATQRINTINGMESYNKAMTTAITALSAQPGEAGKMLSKGLADTFGSPGGANFTDLGKAFIDAGVSQAAGVMDDANNRIAAGEDANKVSMDTVRVLHNMLDNKETLNSLKLIRMGGGANAAAANEVLTLANNLKVYSQADIDAKKKQNDSMGLFTSFFSNFQSIFDGLKGDFIQGFLTPFMDAAHQLDPEKVKAFWKGIDDLAPVFSKLGAELGGFVARYFNADAVKALGAGIVTVVEILGGFFKIIAFGVSLVNGFFDGIAKINKQFAGVATAALLLGLWFGGKGLIKMVTKGILGMFNIGVKDVQIKGNIVRVYGANGSSGGGGGGGGLDGLGQGEKNAAKLTRKELIAKASKQGLTGKAARDFVRAEEATQEAVKLTNATAKVGRMSKIFGGLGKITGVAAMAGIGGQLFGGIKDAASGGASFLTKMIGKVPGAGMLGKAGGKIAGTGVAKGLGRFGGMLIPGVGAAMDGASAINSAKDGNWLAASLYGAGGLANGLGAAADATGIGAIAGVPLDLLGAGLSGLGVASDVTGFGKFGPKKIDAKAAAAAAANPAVPTANAPTVQPTIVDDDAVAQLRTDALLGNQKSIDQLKKIQEGLEKQTVQLYSVARKNLDAQRDTSKNIAKGQGM